MTVLSQTPYRSIPVLLGVVTAFFLGSCTGDTFPTSLDGTQVVPYVTSTHEMKYSTYQVPPGIGNLTRLYLGKMGGYEVPFTLLTLGDLPVPVDSLSELDSAYIQFTVDTSRSGRPSEGTQFYLGIVELDSNYSESGTNHTNVGWLPEPFASSMSILREDTVSGLPVLRFPVDTSWVNAWGDTANPRPLFILEPATLQESGLTALYSTEAQAYRPLLRLFSHSDSASTDTTVNFASDVSIIFPPLLESEEFDSLKIYAGTGAGLRSLLLPDLDTLAIPREAVIVTANLILAIDTAASLVSPDDNFEVQLLAVTDPVDMWQWGQVHGSDPYPGESVTTKQVIDGTATLNVTNVIQYAVSSIRDFHGFKLVSSGSNFLFDHASFHMGDIDSLAPLLEILYEAP